LPQDEIDAQRILVRFLVFVRRIARSFPFLYALFQLQPSHLPLRVYFSALTLLGSKVQPAKIMQSSSHLLALNSQYGNPDNPSRPDD